jgi:hypothetical protein
VPEDFDANISMNPYKRGVCPWPGP